MGRINNEKKRSKPKSLETMVKDNRQRRKKCDKYFPTISVEEGKAKFKEIIEKIRENGYCGVYYPKK